MKKAVGKKNFKKKTKAIVAPKTRKEQRKEKRLQKKENKRNFFQKNKNASIPKDHQKSHVEDESLDEDEGEEIDSDFEDDVVLPPKIAEFQKKQKEEKKVKEQIKKTEKSTNLVEEQHKRDLEKQVKMEKEARRNRMKQLRRANEEEDQNIAKLEKMLKINKSKNKKRLVEKMFSSDGLDYALEFCLGDEDEKPKKKKQKVETNDWNEEDFGENDGPEQNEIDIDEKPGLEDEDDGFDDEDAEGSDFGEYSEESEQEEENEPTVKEDIYGRPLNPETAESAPQKYIPPHQRAAMMGNSENAKQKEKLERLRKSCKGQLNRLSEANMQKIANSIEQFYRQNSRFDMNETLGTIIKESLITPTLTNDRMVQEHVVLIAYLHATVGSEIGAHFLQMFINELMEHLKSVESVDVENKQLNNILLILSYFYMFKIFQNNLMIEIITKIHEVLCEKTIECLLLVFQSIGFRLRKDDPVSFKALIFAIQKKIVESSIELQENARLKYMVDILNAVKNNNMTKLPKYDPELVENLRKKLKAMLTNDKYVTTLNITLTDLLRADEVGKWWVVGSAWSGNIKDIHSAENGQETSSGPADEFSEKVLKLAKKQKMNTADRKSIFCVLMSAEDYLDAFEKILRLSIKDQRTVVTVIIHCCLNEKKYNPYYSHIALKFSNYDRKYMLALQFALWDRINDLQSFELHKVQKLAQFILHLVKNQGLSITALKVVDFSSLEKDENTFCLLKDIICGVLLQPSPEECYPVFEKLASNTKLKSFKGSIRLFMQHYLFRNEKKLGLDAKKLELLKERVKMIDTMLAYEDL